MISKELSPNEYFYFSGGKFLRSIEDLMNCMQDLSNDLFRIHANEQKNDFAIWVREVFNEPKLASELEQLKTQAEVYVFLRSFLITSNLDIARKKARIIMREEAKQLPFYKAVKLAEDELQRGLEQQEKKETRETERETATHAAQTEEDLFAAKIEAYNARLEELKKKISTCRKEGRDPFIPDLMLKPVKAKIALAKVTKLEDDLRTIEDIFSSVEQEIKELEDSKILNVKEEIDLLVKQSLKAENVLRQVKDMMVRNVVTLPRNVPVSTAAQVMVDKGIGCIVITEGDTPIGIITEKDIVKRAAQKQMNLDAITLGSIMTKPIVTIDLNEDVLNASEMMKSRNFRRLVVTEGTKLVGVITQTDLLKEFAEEDRRIKGKS